MGSRFLPSILQSMPSSKKLARGAYDASEAYLASLRFRSSLTRLALLGFIVIPTVLAAIFYGFIASPRYTSEAQFIVRSVSSQRANGLEMLFRTFGLSRTVDDAYAVQKYLESRDAMKALEERGFSIDKVYNHKDADFFSKHPRFWRKDSVEARFDYYRDRVTVTEDSVKGITILKVASFDPTTSRDMAVVLLKLAEEMVNRMNTRAQRDVISVAATEVRMMEEKTIEAQAALTVFRNRELMIDPSKSSLGIMETIASLSGDIAYTSAQIKELRTISPSSPSLQPLVMKVTALEERVNIERSKLAGGDSSLSSKMETYQQLVLRRELAEKSLGSALKSLDVARQEARRQHIYIEQVVAAHLTDEATEPRRIRSIFTIFVLGFAIFSIVWILSVGAGEHAQ